MGKRNPSLDRLSPCLLQREGTYPVLIRNVYCVGRNYRLHAQELGNEVPKSPMIFLKPTHSTVVADGQVIRYPSDAGELHHEVELVFRMARSYDASKPLPELIDTMALGVDFTLRDVQSELKAKGHPWLAAKGFLNSAVLTDFHPFTNWENVQAQSFTLERNHRVVQTGCAKDMLFDLGTLLAHIASNYGLREGDIVFTGTPAGVGPVEDGDVVRLLYGDDVWGQFTVSLQDRNR